MPDTCSPGQGRALRFMQRKSAFMDKICILPFLLKNKLGWKLFCHFSYENI